MKIGQTPYVGRFVVGSDHNNEFKMTKNGTLPARIKIISSPEAKNFAYDPDTMESLTVEAEAENGKPISYQWYSSDDSSGNSGAVIDAAQQPVLTLRGIDVSSKYYYCVLNAEGCPEVKTTPVQVMITKGAYSGKISDTKSVTSDQENRSVTYSLPTLPKGMTWGNITVQQASDFVDQTPVINQNTLSFNTFSQPVNTQAAIKIVINGGKNYTDSAFTLTVVAKKVMSSPAPAKYRIGVNPEQWNFGVITADKEAEAKAFSIQNRGNRRIDRLNLSLSGKDAEHFELSSAQINDLSVNRIERVMVRPKTGLAAGVYQAILNIEGNHRISEQIELSVTVKESNHRQWEPKKDVPLDKEWMIRFNRELDKATVTDQNIYISSKENPNERIQVFVRLSEDGRTVYIRPKTDFQRSKTYILSIQNVRTIDGKYLKENIQMLFETLK